MIHQLHLLQRLKQQPRLGGTYIDRTKQTVAELQQEINNLQNSLNDFDMVEITSGSSAIRINPPPPDPTNL